MALIANDVMTEIGYVLVEKAVNTSMQPPPQLHRGQEKMAGPQAVSPGSMAGIYPGAMLIVGTGDTQEVITVLETYPTIFTAIFQKTHSSIEPLIGATFPSGQPDNPLFTQEEVLKYIADVQNDFLMKVEQAVFVVQPVTFKAGVRTYNAPLDTMRIERASIDGDQLYIASQTALDMIDATWFASSGVPTTLYQDKVNLLQFGLAPTPENGGNVSLWYSQRGQTSLQLNSGFMVPDPLVYIIKYGVLARMWGKDGEMRDPLKEKYCQERYRLGVAIVRRILLGIAAGLQREMKNAGS